MHESSTIPPPVEVISAVAANQEAPGTCSTFRFSQARSLIAGLEKPNPWIYWSDFLASAIAGHLTLHAMFWLPRWYGWTPAVWAGLAVCYVATIILYMRALMFIHELVHLPDKGFKWFRVAWNAVCGIWFFVPSFLYYPHVDHHRRKHYGTEHDGEYLSLSHGHPALIITFVLQSLLVPFLGIFRFVVISPLCWIYPPLRPIVHRHMSSMVVDPFYKRKDVSASEAPVVYLQEVLCFAWGVWFLVRGGMVRGEWLDPFWLVAYATGVGLVTLNAVRTLGAHRWTGDGSEMTFDEQLIDSVNYPNHPWLSELWGPIGTKYHALHHLFPRLPYHNLPRAHRKLTDGLPADSPYHQCNADSLWSEMKALWRRSAENQSNRDTAAAVR